MAWLTERQREVLDFIRRHIERRGVAPTLQEIADDFDFASTAGAQKHVQLLEAKGYLRRVKHQKRGLLLTEDDAPEDDSAAQLPLLGVVAAGSPIDAIPGDERISFPPDLLGGGDHFALRVRGDSMVDDGIHDGDVVVVRAAESAADGETVVALVEGEVTLKRFFRAGPEQIRLQPSNQHMDPLLVDAAKVRLQGVVVALLRQY
jgi:repressor LexA